MSKLTIILALIVSCAVVVSAANVKDNGLSLYDRIFNSQEQLEPSTTLKLVQKLVESLSQLSSHEPMIKSKLQTALAVVEATNVGQSACSRWTVVKRHNLLATLLDEQSERSQDMTPAISLVGQKYDEQLQICRSLIKDKFQAALDVLKDDVRKSLNELSNIVVSPQDLLELKSEYLDNDNLTDELAGFLSSVDCKNGRLQVACSQFQSQIDDSILSLYQFMLNDTEDDNLSSSTDEAARVVTTCIFVAGLPWDADVASFHGRDTSVKI